MTATKSLHMLVSRAKGRALEARGRATGDRRTRLRGRLMRVRGKAGLRTHRFSRRLPHMPHLPHTHR